MTDHEICGKSAAAFELDAMNTGSTRWRDRLKARICRLFDALRDIVTGSL
jgi:hypothetical protein